LKLFEPKLRILKTWSGHGDDATFGLSKFYSEVDWEGITTDITCRCILYQLVVAMPGSAHKCNVHITAKIENLQFLSNDDHTFVKLHAPLFAQENCVKASEPHYVSNSSPHKSLTNHNLNSNSITFNPTKCHAQYSTKD
jgi:hypothetical protein